jgi:hypothetical protein
LVYHSEGPQFPAFWSRLRRPFCGDDTPTAYGIVFETTFSEKTKREGNGVWKYCRVAHNVDRSGAPSCRNRCNQRTFRVVLVVTTVDAPVLVPTSSL